MANAERFFSHFGSITQPPESVQFDVRLLGDADYIHTFRTRVERAFMTTLIRETGREVNPHFAVFAFSNLLGTRLEFAKQRELDQGNDPYADPTVRLLEAVYEDFNQDPMSTWHLNN